MGKGIVAGVFVILLVGGLAGYYAYTNYLPGKVVLSITDPPAGSSPSNSQYSSNVTHIYLTFSRVDIHVVGTDSSSSTSWRSIVGAQTIDLMTVLNISQALGNAKLSTGKYVLIRMFANTTTVTIGGTNYSYNIPNGRIQIIITGGGFQITVGQTVNVLLTISFNDSQIQAHGPNLTPVAKAEVVP